MRSGWIQRHTPIREVNPTRKAKRRALVAKYLGSAAWKAKRAACFARADHRCERVLDGMRCEGPAQVCDHLTYARFTRELPEDLRALCKPCDRIETVRLRANHMRGFTR